MALGLEPPHRDAQRTRKVREGSEGDYRPSERGGAAVLAHGALICPSCNMPVAPRRRLGVAEDLTCSYCAAVAPAREYLVPDVFDTLANEVYVMARL